MQSVERTLDILESLVDFGSEVGLVEISQAVTLPLATVHRLLGTLIRRGYVKQNRQNRKYSLGFRALQMGNDMRQRFSLRLEARPFLHRLMQSTGESANLAVLDDGEVVYIDQAQSSKILRMFTQLGNRLPAHSTGSGKVMLAFGPSEAAEGVLRRYGMARRTQHTIVDADRFRDELARVRAQGFALDDEEHEEGVRCVAVALRDGSGQVVGSLSVSGPVTRMDDARVQEMTPEVVDCGRQLSARLGFAAEVASR
ncbi:MAG: IclR family transcriptional regulator [Candidatus Eremiobacteraeota bacterium]|nr:IclR family transcriptional regulator [Candidatus Eremiobacteraeota bacterium]